MRNIFLSGTSVAVLLASAIAAQAGGFANRDQSAVGEGMSFAGEGTPGMGLSAMFWNPAAVTQTARWGNEVDASYRMPSSIITTNEALTSPALNILNQLCGLPPCPGGDQLGNIRNDSFIPAFYGAVRFAPNWFLGLSVNSSFGFSSNLSEKVFPAVGPASTAYAAQQLSTGAQLKTVDVNPIIGWKINDVFSVGIGPRVVWLSQNSSRDIFAFPSVPSLGHLFGSPVNLQSNGVGGGFSAGVTYTPTPATEIALGYRSQVKINLSGQQSFTPNLVLAAVAPALNGATFHTTASMTLPDQVNLGVRQRMTDTLTLLGTAEWTHWSVLQNVVFAGSTTVVGSPDTINFNYRDGWFLSVGAEYQVLPKTTLRAGIGYDSSPVNGTLGWVALPGANSTSASVGLSQKLMDHFTLDLAYSYTWINNQTINVGPGNPDQAKLITAIPGLLSTWVGNVSSHNQVISVALRYNFSEAPPTPSPSSMVTKAK